MITAFDQFKTRSGNWVVIVKTDKDNTPFGGPYVWWETDSTGEKGLQGIIKRAML